MDIPVTEFIRPHGQQVVKIVNVVDAKVSSLAQDCIDKGARFTVEDLNGSGIALCCEYRDTDVVCIVVGSLGIHSLERLFKESHAKLEKM